VADATDLVLDTVKRNHRVLSDLQSNKEPEKVTVEGIQLCILLCQVEHPQEILEATLKWAKLYAATRGANRSEKEILSDALRFFDFSKVSTKYIEENLDLPGIIDNETLLRAYKSQVVKSAEKNNDPARSDLDPSGFPLRDINFLMETTGVSRDNVLMVLRHVNGDVARAHHDLEQFFVRRNDNGQEDNDNDNYGGY
jgi:NACalpha-BTF3-like transcription factor